MYGDPRYDAAKKLSGKFGDLAINSIQEEFEKKQPLPEEVEDPTIAEEYSDLSPLVEEEPLPPEIIEYLSRVM